MKFTLLFIIVLTWCLSTTVFAQSPVQPKLTIDTGGDLATVGFSPDGSVLATTSGDKTEVRLWDTRSGALKAKLSGKDDPFSTLQGYSYPKQFLSGPSYFSFSPDGRLLAVAALMAREVRVWDLRTGKLYVTLTSLNDMHRVEFSPDGHLLVLAAGFQGLQLLDVQAGKMERTRWDVKSVRGVYDAAFIQNGATLVVALESADKGRTGYYFFDVATGKVKSVIPTSKEAGNLGHLSADGRRLAVVDGSNNVRLWETGSGRAGATIKGIKGKVYDLAVSQDGKIVATVSDDNAVNLWDSEKAELKATITVAEKVALVFSQAGALIATAGAGGVKIWHANTGALRQTLSDAYFPLSFSPDGRLLATAGKGHTAILWQVSTE